MRILSPPELSILAPLCFKSYWQLWKFTFPEAHRCHVVRAHNTHIDKHSNKNSRFLTRAQHCPNLLEHVAFPIFCSEWQIFTSCSALSRKNALQNRVWKHRANSVPLFYCGGKLQTREVTQACPGTHSRSKQMPQFPAPGSFFDLGEISTAWLLPGY